MSRPICPKCHYPQTACLCDRLRPMSTRVECIVLQDPNEVKQAKNSVKLMRAVLDNLQIHVGETPEDFAELRGYLERQQKPVFLLYPSEASHNLSEMQAPSDAILLLLDGTWRKAYKLLQLNLWLKQYPGVHLELEQATNYTIRKAKREDSLSTLEAAAMAISCLDKQCDTSPLTEALAALVEQHLSAMPAEIKLRYLSQK
ncbi:DTW domain-containing protein [Shewanella sp. AS1]|uniref:tRNA-uridine aminocarboxypropyltransferase n=1 Tax=Shewanella sp. AS1 TaxID=2907626 RepID=UPI001F3F47ED|nr:tRNA-uridine aminocarboxypropyltransferase [Shewanella sp. AS1]MCE9680115.1 DTW domain-containing protein [Shewanella sp. AS1]